MNSKDIRGLVNARYDTEIAQLRQQFTTADPLTHLVVDSFCSAGFLSTIEVPERVLREFRPRN